jgi:hypothetical protein
MSEPLNLNKDINAALNPYDLGENTCNKLVTERRLV